MCAGNLSEQVTGQWLNVFRSFPQRREADLKTVDAIQQVRSKHPVVNDRVEISICRGDDANVHFHFSNAAHSEERARLDRAQKFRL